MWCLWSCSFLNFLSEINIELTRHLKLDFTSPIRVFQISSTPFSSDFCEKVGELFVSNNFISITYSCNQIKFRTVKKFFTNLMIFANKRLYSIVTQLIFWFLYWIDFVDFLWPILNKCQFVWMKWFIILFTYPLSNRFFFRIIRTRSFISK